MHCEHMLGLSDREQPELRVPSSESCVMSPAPRWDSHRKCPVWQNLTFQRNESPLVFFLHGIAVRPGRSGRSPVLHTGAPEERISAQEGPRSSLRGTTRPASVPLRACVLCDMSHVGLSSTKMPRVHWPARVVRRGTGDGPAAGRPAVA